MKKCIKCQEDKELTEFNKNKLSKDQLTSWCKKCVKEKSNLHYKNNYNEIIKRSKIHNKNNTFKAQEIIDSFKENKKCEKCGYNEYKCALDFHHIDSSKKNFNISTGGRKSLERLKNEIEKCILLCSNCHRTFHFLEKRNNITIFNFIKMVP